MITPLQQTAGIAVSDLMRSMVEAMEERQREEQEKAKGIRKDETVRSHPVPDESQRVANEKISAYLFGALKPDSDAFAALVSRFSSALAVTQEKGESSFSFSQRLRDALALTDGFEKPQDSATIISLKSVGVSEQQVISVMTGNVDAKTAPMAMLAARLATSAGLSGKEGDFDERISVAITAARAVLPKSVSDLEESNGLKEIGISARQMIDAIANPSGDAARAVKEALDAQSQRKTSMTQATMKILQRLEDVADPKTKKELQAERGENRIGEINDAEVEAEREADIRIRDAQGKLEDVKELQDVVKEHMEASANAEAKDKDGAGTVDISSEIALISVLAAAPQPETPAAENDNEATETRPNEGASGEAERSDAEDDATEILEVKALVGKARDSILPISIDEDGLYELLKKKAA